MRVIEKTIYQFNELSDEAKSTARNWYRSCDDGFWNEEYKDSINTFIEHFGASLTDWNIGPYAPIDYKVAFDNSNFRGIKLCGFKLVYMPTGFCADCDLWGTFYAEFKRTGNAKHAFEQAVYAGFKAWRDDWEYQLSDDAVDESIIANEYEFYENGKRF
jgi:hypothetical protein